MASRQISELLGPLSPTSSPRAPYNAPKYPLEISKVEMTHQSNSMTHCLLCSTKLGYLEDLKNKIIPIQLLTNGNEILDDIGSIDSKMQFRNAEKDVLCFFSNHRNYRPSSSVNVVGIYWL